MQHPPLTDPHSTAAALWRGVRRSGRHRQPLRLLIGWMSPSDQHAERLRKALDAVADVSLAGHEEHEPEDNPLETIIYIPARRLSLADVEARLYWASTFGHQFDATLSRGGL